MADLLDILQNGEYSLQVNGKSKHLNTLQKFNEDNPGFGVMATKDGNFLTAGGYKNSFAEPSYYVGGGIKKRFGDDFYIEPGLLAGFVTGYEDPLTPMLLPMLALGKKDFGALNLMYAPEVKDKNPATLMMNLSVPFK